jgi:hypothetical protein
MIPQSFIPPYLPKPQNFSLIFFPGFKDAPPRQVARYQSHFVSLFCCGNLFRNLEVWFNSRLYLAICLFHPDTGDRSAADDATLKPGIPVEEDLGTL